MKTEIRSIRESQAAFLEWLFDFNAVDDPDAIFATLEGCHDKLPLQCREPLGLDSDSTFADAVELVGSRWQLSTH